MKQIDCCKILGTFFLFSLCFFFSVHCFAQRERNYIYILDCTKSMSGYNGAPNIWEPTKNYLRTDIERQTPQTTVHVLPFQGNNLPSFSFMANKFNWKDMEKTLNEYLENVTRTNICDAWEEASKYIDINKDNYIYLLTDGVDNVKGTNALAQRLSNFCGKYQNTRAFYVVLTKNAIDTKIKEIVDNCPVEQFVDASKKLDPFGSFDDNLTIYANTLNLKRIHKLLFSAAGVFPGNVICNDPYFDVKMISGSIKDGVVPILISAKRNIQEINTQLPEQYQFFFTFTAKGVQIINPKVRVVMTNKPEREFEIINEELDLGDAEWYDSFLFWGAKDPDTLKVDLKALFNDEARKDGSTLQVKIADTEGLKDFKLFFNGIELEDGTITFDSRAMPSSTILYVVYNTEAKEGKRYLRITPTTKNNLENINSEPAEQFDVSLRSEYDVVTNPLVIILWWLILAIITALLVWFLIIKLILYPTFKVGSIMITDPYYSTVKIKGARKVIFSSKKVEQSTLNRIFTGKVICNVNSCWTQPLMMEPAKKKIRVLRTRTYVFDPFGSQLNPHTEYIVDNTETNEKIKMTIN